MKQLDTCTDAMTVAPDDYRFPAGILLSLPDAARPARRAKVTVQQIGSSSCEQAAALEERGALTLGPTKGILIVVGSLVLLGVLLAGTSSLQQFSLLYLRSVITVAAALILHVSRRDRSSILVAGLHLAAIESCITDLMANGTWAMGWGDVSQLRRLTPPVLGLLAIAVSTTLGYRRLLAGCNPVRHLWLLAVASGVVGTAVGPRVMPIVIWAVVGTAISLLALLWVVDLNRAIGTRGDLPVTFPRHGLPMLAMWVVAACALISVMIFQSVPHVPDEVAYWFHAKYFAAGHLWLPLPPDWSSFSLPNSWHTEGRWYSIFPPGWPSILAVGFALGVPTLVNPVLAGATIVALFRLLQRLYGNSTATVGCVLLAFSPAFLLMSSGLMSHPLSALCTVVAADALHQAWNDRTRVPAVIAGAAIGLATLTRPFEGALLTTAFGVYMLFRFGWLRSRGAIVACCLFVITAVSIGALLLPYNHGLTGSAFHDPIATFFDATYYPGGNRLGFGADIANFGFGNDFLPGHSPFEAVLNSQLNAQLVNSELFAWPLGSLAAVALYLAWWKRLWRPEDMLFATIVVTIVIGQGFYWYSGADYGARYWYQILIPCVVLSARAVTSVVIDRKSLAHTAMLMGVIGFVVFLPWRAVTKYIGYRGMGSSVVRMTRACDMSDGLVLVRNALPPNSFQAYASAALLNAPTLEGHAPVFAREVSPEITDRLRAALPGRAVWIIEVPVDPRQDARVVQRPAGASPSANPACKAVEAPTGGGSQ